MKAGLFTVLPPKTATKLVECCIQVHQVHMNQRLMKAMVLLFVNTILSRALGKAFNTCNNILKGRRK